MLFHKDWIARSESVDVLNDPPLIVLLDISILVGKQLLLGKITFLHHCLKHLQRKSSVQESWYMSIYHFLYMIGKGHTMLVILSTVAWVAISLTRANSTVCPPWATSIPQYLGQLNGGSSQDQGDINLAEFLVQTWWIAHTAQSCTASSCRGLFHLNLNCWQPW